MNSIMSLNLCAKIVEKCTNIQVHFVNIKFQSFVFTENNELSTKNITIGENTHINEIMDISKKKIQCPKVMFKKWKIK